MILLKKEADTRQVKRLERNDVEIVDNVKKDHEAHNQGQCIYRFVSG